MLKGFRQFYTNSIKKMPFTYNEAVSKLNSLQSNASLLEQLRKAGPAANMYSLPEMRVHFKRIGYKPEDFNQLQIIHVAGTKGKGSTSSLTQSILHHYPLKDNKPLKTGLFTSPHLVAVRERIRIDGVPISEELFAKYSEDVWNRLEDTKDQYFDFYDKYLNNDPKNTLRQQRNHPDKPVYFRYLTLLALHAFMQEKVDVAILEVGIGGESDSTNIIEKPVVCGITALGLDHVNILGNTIDKIAWQKAGIIKNGRPVVTIEQPPEALEVIKQRANEKNAPLEIVYPSQIDKLKDIKVGLAGIHQRYNALVAISLAKKWLEECRGIQFKENEVVPEGFIKGLEKVVWPGRGQVLTVDKSKYASKINHNNNSDNNNNNNQQQQHSSPLTWYLDGAHTVESLDVCTQWFKDTVKQDKDISRVLVFNCTNGRDGPKLLNVVSQLQNTTAFDHVIFTTNVTFREGYTGDNTNFVTSMKDALEMQKMLSDSWKEQLPNFDKNNIHITGSIEEAIDWVVDYSNQNKQQKIQVLTTGSLILVGNTLTVLGMPAQ
ncbi:unnamed protein product [Cunninghamella blakesleeana]